MLWRYDNPLGRVWWWWSQAAGIFVVAGAISAAFLWLTAPKGPVIVANGPPYDISTPIKVGGPLTYKLDFFVRENCPGDIVTVFRSNDNGVPKLVTQRRPASFLRPAGYPGTPFARDLPLAVTPGHWQATNYRESQCPTRRVVDQYAFFEFDVIP